LNELSKDALTAKKGFKRKMDCYMFLDRDASFFVWQILGRSMVLQSRHLISGVSWYELLDTVKP